MSKLLAKPTPMMQQWMDAKDKHKDAILLFRMGDFYELFGEDAILAAPILDLTLTSRDRDKVGLKMAGFPFHSAENYIARLIDNGHKVAICEQLEDPKNSRGLVKRGVTNVITPGTFIEGDNAKENELAPLVAVAYANDLFALCALDIGVAAFLVTSSTSSQKISDELFRLRPREIVISSDDHKTEAMVKAIHERNAKWTMRIEKRSLASLRYDKSYLDTVSLNEAEQSASEQILAYVAELRGEIPSHIGSPKKYSIEETLLIDEATRENLDLFPKKRGDRCNLRTVLDETKTPMGYRALTQSISAPTTDLFIILTRHQLVEELLATSSLRERIRKLLSQFYDIEKLTTLAAIKKLNPKKMAGLRDCLFMTDEIMAEIKSSQRDGLNNLIKNMPDISDLKQCLKDSLVENPPLNLKDGGAFKRGFDLERDEYADLIRNGRELLISLEDVERKKTNIPTLKVRYTRVFGYYIEVTKSHLKKVPNHYQRKQTVANAERYVTMELSELQVKLNTAEERIQEIEENRFNELQKIIADRSHSLMCIGRVIAELDLVASFAEVACIRSYVKPDVRDKAFEILDIVGGRHPIVEDICLRKGSYFVPNHMRLDSVEASLLLVTGPNMAGKSTIMRQAALIQLMAQMGSFVPAESATMSICDAIFARVGASDDLSTGRSTFMVEMSETASILNNSSRHSLILLDEIGRGTSTYDGLAIAQSVAEYIHNHIGARTIFATHYHELTKLAHANERIKNYHVEIDEGDKQIRFLYTLAAGPCLKSFGIEVARLSGLPDLILRRALDILQSLEGQQAIETSETEMVRLIDKSKVTQGMPQLDLFGAMSPCSKDVTMGMVEKLITLNLNCMTPLQALNRLSEMQNACKKMIKSSVA